MKPATKALHLTLIRLLKGCLNAWERWVNLYADDEGRPPEGPQNA